MYAIRSFCLLLVSYYGGDLCLDPGLYEVYGRCLSVDLHPIFAAVADQFRLIQEISVLSGRTIP